MNKKIDELAICLNELAGSTQDISCWSYRQLLEKNLREKNYPEGEAYVYNLIKNLCTLSLRQDDTGNYTLRSFIETSAGVTSFDPGHLSDEDENTLFEMLEHIDLLSLKARIGDVLWLRKGCHKYQAALIAIPAYLGAIEALREDAHDLCPSLGRALAIAGELGTSGRELLSGAVSRCVEFLISIPATSVDGMHAKLLRALSLYNTQHREVLICKIDEFAQYTFAHGHMLLCRDLLETQLILCKQSKEKQDEIKIKICESFVQEADNATTAYTESLFLNEAIESYLRHGLKSQAEALYGRLQETQQKSASEMHTFRTEPIDILDLVKEAELHVADKPIMEAMLRLAFIGPVFDINKMIPESAKRATERSFLQIVTPTLIDESGQSPFKVKGITNWTEDEATNFQLYEDISFKIDWFVNTTLLPAIRKIAAEHDLSPGVFFSLMKHHPFIPEGFEGYYARGIAAGFKLDFSAANLFLVPQFENSLRYIIKQNGGQTFIVDPEKGQRARNIDSVINDEIIAKVFDDAHLMMIKHLLIDPKFGGLRHSLAHGLLPYNALSSNFAIYLWWIIFKVLFVPYAPTQRR